MQTHVNPRVLRCSDFAIDAAQFILTEIRQAIAVRGLGRVALSGGGTPRIVHRELVRLAGDLPWNHVQFTFGDERCVPPDHPDSNFLMARESLLDPLGIPEGNVFRMRGEIAPEIAAQEYEDKLAAVAARFQEPRYVHDIVLLGMGPDGHTASLFPGSPALDESERNVIPAIGPKPPPQRLTMTFPLINAARQVAFLIQGEEKRPLVETIIQGGSTLPAARIQPASGSLTWILG